VATHSVREALPRFSRFGRGRGRARARLGGDAAAAGGAASPSSTDTRGTGASAGAGGSGADARAHRQLPLESLGDVCCYASLRWRPPRIGGRGGISGSAAAGGSFEAVAVVGGDGDAHTPAPPAAAAATAAAAAAVDANLHKWQRSLLSFAAEHPSAALAAAGAAAKRAARAHRAAGAASAPLAGPAQLQRHRRRGLAAAAAADADAAGGGAAAARSSSASARDALCDNAHVAQGVAEAQLAASILGGFTAVDGGFDAAADVDAADRFLLGVGNPSARERRVWRTIMDDGLLRAAAAPTLGGGAALMM
jgi:hypothetical protein